MLTLLGAAGFLVALAVVVPLLAYGLSALLDWRNWDNRDDGGTRVPSRPGPSRPSSPLTRSSEPGEPDGTVN